MNEHPRICKKIQKCEFGFKLENQENQSTRFVSSIVLPHSVMIAG